jgi:type IX secretion system PorP/SprF family membrane protein
MYKAFSAVYFVLLVGLVSAQQDPRFSQYMNNSLALNPGYAGSRDLVCISAIHHQELVGISGSGGTSVFSVNAPINRIKSGVGISIMQDKRGLNSDLSFNAIYSYSLPINEGKLGIGVSLGFYNTVLNPEWKSSDGSSLTDASLPSTKDPTMNFDLGFGVYYRTEVLFFGISSTHITEPEVVKSGTAGMVLNRHFYLSSGYTISLPNPQFELQPSVFIGTLGSGKTSSVDLNGLLLYNKRFWGGVSYRLSSAIVGMVGIELKNGLRVCYSYDFSTNALHTASSGTHELSLGYNFSIIKEKIPRKFKSVRFL